MSVTMLSIALLLLTAQPAAAVDDVCASDDPTCLSDEVALLQSKATVHQHMPADMAKITGDNAEHDGCSGPNCVQGDEMAVNHSQLLLLEEKSQGARAEEDNELGAEDDEEKTKLEAEVDELQHVENEEEEQEEEDEEEEHEAELRAEDVEEFEEKEEVEENMGDSRRRRRRRRDSKDEDGDRRRRRRRRRSKEGGGGADGGGGEGHTTPAPPPAAKACVSGNCTSLPIFEFETERLASARIWTKYFWGGFQKPITAPRRVHSAACQDKIISSWTTQTTKQDKLVEQLFSKEGVTVGHVGWFSVQPGNVQMITDVKLDQCVDVGGVTASEDCSIIAALCISRESSSAFPNFKKDFVEEVKKNVSSDMWWTADHKGSGLFVGWETPSSAHGKHADVLNMYLLEWHGEVKSKPDAVVLINKGIVWRDGNYDVSLNSEGTLYNFDLVVGALASGHDIYGYHKIDTHFAMKRDDYTYAQAFSAVNCAPGHTYWNKLRYNKAVGKWGRWCLTDGCNKKYNGGTRGHGHWFTATPSKDIQTQKGGEFHVGGDPFRDLHTWRKLPAEIVRQPVGEDAKPGNDGGPSDIVSFGSKGWVGVMVVTASESTNAQKAAVVQIPADAPSVWNTGSNEFTEAPKKVIEYLENLVPKGKGVARLRIAHVGNTSEESDNFLFGWAEVDPAHIGGPHSLPTKYNIAEVDHMLKMKGDVIEVDNTGWDEKSDWVTIPASGCVVWPSVWGDTSGPKGLYSPPSGYQGVGISVPADKVAGYYTNTLRFTLYCPKGP